MKTRDQFFAAGRSIEQMRDELGADSLGYLSISNLTESIGMGNDSLCLGCLTGVYPVSIPGEKYLYQTELEGY
jgi:amidophosphoribosyltransferase